jgi:hypothetical protein
MKRLITAITTAFALTGAAACSQNAARDVDQPVSARQDSSGTRDTTAPAYRAMQRADSTTMIRTDTTGRMVTPPPAVRDTSGTQPATTSPR